MRVGPLAALACLALGAAGCGGAGSDPDQVEPDRAGCPATPVHYERQPDALGGLRDLPWIAPEPTSSGAVGHLFYWPGSPWGRRHEEGLRIWTGGHAPDTRTNMKILWESYGAKDINGAMTVEGRRLDGPGRFTRHIDFGPSIVDVPRAGCWRLTLHPETGPALHLTLLAQLPSTR